MTESVEIVEGLELLLTNDSVLAAVVKVSNELHLYGHLLRAASLGDFQEAMLLQEANDDLRKAFDHLIEFIKLRKTNNKRKEQNNREAQESLAKQKEKDHAN